MSSLFYAQSVDSGKAADPGVLNRRVILVEGDPPLEVEALVRPEFRPVLVHDIDVRVS